MRTRTGGVSRVRFIEMWRFREGIELSVGDANDLDSPAPMVTGAVALGLINAGKAEALAVADLDVMDED